jgi:prolyl oligopeptidase
MHKINLFIVPFLSLIISCASVEIPQSLISKEISRNTETELPQTLITNKISIKIDEDDKFQKYLDSDWDKTLSENPLFATYIGDKRFNDKINPNTIDQFIKDRNSDLLSYKELLLIDKDLLNDDNKLNYQLKEFDLKSDLSLSEFPIYYLRLNQRGGIQSFYETGNRLVYTSKQDYYDWLSRLKQFPTNIITFLEINKKRFI